jgi:hypothetical protein
MDINNPETIEYVLAWIDKLELKVEPKDVILLFNEFYKDVEENKTTLIEDIFKNKIYSETYYLMAGILTEGMSNEKMVYHIQCMAFMVWLSKQANVKFLQ